MKRVHLFTSTGDGCKRPYPVERATRKISEPVQHFIVLVYDDSVLYIAHALAFLYCSLLEDDGGVVARYSGGF